MSTPVSIPASSITVETTLAQLPANPAISVRKLVHRQLSGLPKSQQLTQVISLFHRGQEREEQTLEVMAEAWEYLVSNQLWLATDQFKDLQTLKRQVDPESDLQEMIRRHQTLSRRKQTELNGIVRHWSVTPQEGLPEDLCPVWFGDSLLRHLHRLSRTLALDAAIDQLRQVKATRIRTPRAPNDNHLIPSDVEKVIRARRASSITATPGPEPIPEVIEIDDDSTGTAPTPPPASSPTPPPASSPKPSATSSPHPSNTSSPVSPLAAASDPSPSSQLETSMAALSQGLVSDSQSEDAFEQMAPPQAPPRHGPSFHPINPSTVLGGIPETGTPEKEVDLVSGCGCSLAMEDPKTWPAVAGDGEQRVPFLRQWLGNQPLSAICRIHQRAMLAYLDMKNNLPNSDLIFRLERVRLLQGHLQELARQEPRWFRRSSRPQPGSDLLSLYRVVPKCLDQDIPSIDFKQLLDRFAGSSAAQDWLTDGNLLVPGVFEYLDHPDILAYLDWEYAMYAYHEQPDAGLARQGWVRHMYYSLIQQLIRQDPVWYALVVATRPDHQWRLVSYPYQAKETRPSEATGFLHLDINVGRYLDAGDGANLISSSLALDDEDECGCTVIVPGFHRHIRAWHKRTQSRGTTGGGATTNCNATYTKEDRQTWGSPRPAPCKAFGLRLTHPAIIHGSTAVSGKRRRSLFAWHTGICDDHSQLDIPGTLSWEQVAACHRDRLIPTVQPNGQRLRIKTPTGPFGASTLLRVRSPLANALVGARRWSDPDVMRERNILLGGDDGKAWELVDQIRQELVEAYLGQMAELQQLEAEIFGERSFSRSRDKSGNMAEGMDLD